MHQTRNSRVRSGRKAVSRARPARLRTYTHGTRALLTHPISSNYTQASQALCTITHCAYVLCAHRYPVSCYPNRQQASPPGINQIQTSSDCCCRLLLLRVLRLLLRRLVHRSAIPGRTRHSSDLVKLHTGLKHCAPSPIAYVVRPPIPCVPSYPNRQHEASPPALPRISPTSCSSCVKLASSTRTRLRPFEPSASLHALPPPSIVLQRQIHAPAQPPNCGTTSTTTNIRPLKGMESVLPVGLRKVSGG